MQTARVVGRATATVKHESLSGQRLLLVQPLLADERHADGYPLLAVDGVGARKGDLVMITSDGKGARELLGTEITPVRWTIIGISDDMNHARRA